MSEVREHGVVGADGVEREVDTIIFGTGFHVTDPPIAERVRGADGRSLAETWAGSPRGYLGTTVAGFPNFFLFIGPNLGNGHSSAIVLIEAQLDYLVSALETMRDRDIAAVDVRRDVQAAYNQRVQAALQGTVWNAGGCSSYYLDRNGTNSTIYPWTTVGLRRRTAPLRPRRLRRPAGGRERGGGMRPARIPLEDAVVAVTGAGRGIGRATAEAFAARGARVLIGDIDLAAAEDAAEAIGGRARALPLDVTDRDSFAAFIGAEGRLDVLVNNAGVMPTGPFLSEPDAVAEATMAINVGGPLLGMRLAIPGMIERGRGHVVNVASLAGKLQIPGLAVYVASKHAAVGLSAAVREEVRGSGVTVTTVLPTAVRTRLSAGIPLGGLLAVEPEDVARAIVGSLERRPEEVVVPRLLGAAPALAALTPPWAMRALRRLIGGDRVLTAADAQVRADYEATIVRETVAS